MHTHNGRGYSSVPICDKNSKLGHSFALHLFIANAWIQVYLVASFLAAQTVFSNTWLLPLAPMLSDRSRRAL